MAKQIVPQDMKPNTLHSSNNYGDFVITFYRSAKSIGVCFLRTRNEAIVHSGNIRTGKISDKKLINENKSRAITQEELKGIICYDPLTGVFTRIANLNSNEVAGDSNGTVWKSCGKSYFVFSIRDRIYLAHRLAFLYMTGSFPLGQVDHDDGNGNNNKRNNLNDVTQLDNAKNVRMPITNKSGCVGVSWKERYKKWHAQIKANRKAIHLGYFTFFNDAVIARKMAEYEYGFHKNHGSIRPL